MRAVEEWIGSNPDAAIPPRVKLRIFEKHNGICAVCTRKLMPGRFEFDHETAIINGGEHRESNIRPVCTSPCHSEKTRKDKTEKSQRAMRKKKRLGLQPKRTIPGRRFDGTPIPSHWVNR